MIVGCGAVAEKFHLPALSRVPEIQISALVDKSVTRAERLRKLFGLRNAEVATDTFSILDKSAVDAVLILTPTETHAEIAVAAARARKHIFCEKPLGPAVEDAERMISEAKKAGVVNMVGCNLRFTSQVQTLKRLVSEDFLGQTWSLDCGYVLDYSTWPAVIARDKSGFSPWLDAGHHLVDLARYIMGSPKSIYAKNAPVDAEEPKGIVASILFSKGAIASLHFSWSGPAYLGLRMIGTEGLLSVDFSSESILALKKGLLSFKSSPWLVIKAKAPFSPFCYELSHFAQSILKNTKPLAPFTEGLEDLKVLLAACESIKNDDWISLLCE